MKHKKLIKDGNWYNLNSHLDQTQPIQTNTGFVWVLAYIKTQIYTPSQQGSTVRG